MEPLRLLGLFMVIIEAFLFDHNLLKSLWKMVKILVSFLQVLLENCVLKYSFGCSCFSYDLIVWWMELVWSDLMRPLHAVPECFDKQRNIEKERNPWSAYRHSSSEGLVVFLLTFSIDS